jgi:RNA recognition motif-containing protein
LDWPDVFARVKRHPAGATGQWAPPGEKETAISRKVFVGNLSFDVTREELIQVFNEVGSVVDAKVPTDRDTGRPRGFAFVEFEDEEGARRCIEQMNGRDLGGRSLRVNEAEDRPPRAPGGMGRPPGGPGSTRRPPGGSGGMGRPPRGPSQGFSRPSPGSGPPSEPDYAALEKEERRSKRFRQKPAGSRKSSRRRRDQVVDDEEDY